MRYLVAPSVSSHHGPLLCSGPACLGIATSLPVCGEALYRAGSRLLFPSPWTLFLFCICRVLFAPFLTLSPIRVALRPFPVYFQLQFIIVFRLSPFAFSARRCRHSTCYVNCTYTCTFHLLPRTLFNMLSCTCTQYEEYNPLRQYPVFCVIPPAKAPREQRQAAFHVQRCTGSRAAPDHGDIGSWLFTRFLCHLPFLPIFW